MRYYVFLVSYIAVLEKLIVISLMNVSAVHLSAHLLPSDAVAMNSVIQPRFDSDHIAGTPFVCDSFCCL